MNKSKTKLRIRIRTVATLLFLTPASIDNGVHNFKEIILTRLLIINANQTAIVVLNSVAQNGRKFHMQITVADGRYQETNINLKL